MTLTRNFFKLLVVALLATMLVIPALADGDEDCDVDFATLRTFVHEIGGDAVDVDALTCGEAQAIIDMVLEMTSAGASDDESAQDVCPVPPDLSRESSLDTLTPISVMAAAGGDAVYVSWPEDMIFCDVAVVQLRHPYFAVAYYSEEQGWRMLGGSSRRSAWSFSTEQGKFFPVGAVRHEDGRITLVGTVANNNDQSYAVTIDSATGEFSNNAIIQGQITAVENNRVQIDSRWYELSIHQGQYDISQAAD